MLLWFYCSREEGKERKGKERRKNRFHYPLVVRNGTCWRAGGREGGREGGGGGGGGRKGDRAEG